MRARLREVRGLRSPTKQRKKTVVRPGRTVGGREARRADGSNYHSDPPPLAARGQKMALAGSAGSQGLRGGNH